MKNKYTYKFVMGCKARVPLDEMHSNGLPRTMFAYELLNSHLGIEVYRARGNSESGYWPYTYGHSRKDRMIRKIYTMLCRDLADRFAGSCTHASRGEEMVNYIHHAKTAELSPTKTGLFRFDTAVGVELETYGLINRKELSAKLPYWARAKSDGSIRPNEGQDHEIVALFPRSELEPRLFRLCKTLRNLGLQTNRSCGLHVHIDYRKYTEKEMMVQARIMDAWLKAMAEIVPLSRRDNQYCGFGISTSQRYRAVNVCSFSAHRTLEIRLHSATLDYTKILAWIRLLELLRVIRKKPKAAGCIGTLEQLPLATHDLAYWKMRHQQINPTQYEQNLSPEQE